MKLHKARERKKRLQSESKPDWTPLYVDPTKAKQKYVKNSEKTIMFENQRYASTRLGKKSEETNILPSIKQRHVSDLGYKIQNSK